MFGYIMANAAAMTKEENRIYSAYYCGLCHSLKRNFGNISRLTLTYDLSFLSLFLSSVYNSENIIKEEKCFLHPISKINVADTPFSDYAAFMNIILCYYKFLDDINDDKSFNAFCKTKMFEKPFLKAEREYPEKCRTVKEIITELSYNEKENILNPDIPSAVFGKLMGEMFRIKEDRFSEPLYNFGFHLGKFIYILDAMNDLKADLKKKRYNPLILHSSEEFDDMINILMADTVSSYKKLSITKNTSIIENILFSGVLLKTGRKNKNGSGSV